MASRTSRVVYGTALAVVGMAGVAFAQADLDRGEAAVRAAYEFTEGDEGGFGGTVVDQCRVESATVVRCVISETNGDFDLDSEDSATSNVPTDYGLATFAPDGTITTSREPFTEPVVALDSDIRVRERLRPSRSGRLRIEVSPAVAARVTRSAVIGSGRSRIRTRISTIAVPAGSSDVELPLSERQRDWLRKKLRERKSLRAVVSVSVVGDVGPADAKDTRGADVRIVRR